MKSRVAITIMAILVTSTFAGVHVRADVTVNDIVTIVLDYVNGSKVVPVAFLNFTGSPPDALDDVDFQWYDPSGYLIYSVASDPDNGGFARSNHTVDQTGTWWINASYTQLPDLFHHNVSFEVVDDHWDSSTRIIEQDLVVGESATLTIDPGATIAFHNGTRLSVVGTLIAQGMWNQMITFTSNSSAPQKGDWHGVNFRLGSGSSVFDFAKVEYAGDGTYIENTNTTVRNCRFENNMRGIRLYASTSTILNNTMENNTYGFYSYASHPVLTSNVARGNYHGFHSSESGLFVSRMNIAQDNEQTGFHLDSTTIDSTGDISLGSVVGLRLRNSGGVFEDANISGIDDGVDSDEGDAMFRNSTILGSLRDLYVKGGSSLTLVDSTFGGVVSAGPGCPACYVFVRNYLSIGTIDHDTSSPVENAEVRVFDNDVLVFSGQTDSQGFIRNITLAHETYEDEMKINNDTRILVTHPTLFFAYHNRTIFMNVSHTEVFEGDTVDTDGDGEPDFSDLDDDGDGLSDEMEDGLGTNPLSEDTDGDTMPDGWEHWNSLDPNDSSDAESDLDVDGFTNLEEYLNDTNPNDPHSHPPVEDGQEEDDFLNSIILYLAIILVVTAVIVASVILMRRRRKES